MESVGHPSVKTQDRLRVKGEAALKNGAGAAAILRLWLRTGSGWRGQRSMGLAAEHGFYPERVEWVGSFLLPLTRKNKEKESVMDSWRSSAPHHDTFLFSPRHQKLLRFLRRTQERVLLWYGKNGIN